MYTSRLSNMRKKELAAIATEFGLYPEGLKSELESRVSQYFAANKDTLSADPRYSHYFRTGLPTPRPSRRSTITTSKLLSLSDTPAPLSKLPPTSTITVTPNVATAKSAMFSSPSGPVPSMHSTPAFATPAFATPAAAMHAPAETASPPSALSRSVTRIRSLASATSAVVQEQTEVSITQTVKTSHTVRARISSASAVNRMSTLVEFAVLVKKLLPCSIEKTSIHVPYGPVISTTRFYIPECSTLLSYKAVWQPVLFWGLYFVAIPVLLSYFMNFTSIKAANARARHTFDPLTFNVTKLLIAFLFFMPLSAATASVVPGSTSTVAGTNLPFAASGHIIKDYVSFTTFITGIVGTLISFYSAILL
ncbi:uncharacterized protein V1518DRAFT_405391 [Limtongia smithiae]|uniref:uncharacterized protein n=1 Tax=Limtongia smithiae TaxID=1125753 RepID=UPI0034CD569D